MRRRRSVGSSFFLTGYGAGGRALDLGEESTTTLDPVDVGPIAGDDFEVSDTLLLEHNDRLMQHEGDVDVDAEYGQNLHDLDEGREKGPMTTYDAWADTYANAPGSEGGVGIHMGRVDRHGAVPRPSGNVDRALLEPLERFFTARGWFVARPGELRIRSATAPRAARAVVDIRPVAVTRVRFELVDQGSHAQTRSWYVDVADPAPETVIDTITPSVEKVEEWCAEATAEPEQARTTQPRRFGPQSEPVFTRLNQGGWARTSPLYVFVKDGPQRRVSLRLLGEGVPSGAAIALFARNPAEAKHPWKLVKRYSIENVADPALFDAALRSLESWLVDTRRGAMVARDIVVTIPRSRLREIEAEEAGNSDGRDYYWQMGRLPKEQPRRIYFAWDGAVRAFHEVTGMDREEGRLYMAPEIHEVSPEPMPSFRGFRYRAAIAAPTEFAVRSWIERMLEEAGSSWAKSLARPLREDAQTYEQDLATARTILGPKFETVVDELVAARAERLGPSPTYHTEEMSDFAVDTWIDGNEMHSVLTGADGEAIPDAYALAYIGAPKMIQQALDRSVAHEIPSELRRVRKLVYLDSIELPDALQGRGLGGMMLDDIIDTARGADASAILTVPFYPGQDPTGFYETRGFVAAPTPNTAGYADLMILRLTRQPSKQAQRQNPSSTSTRQAQRQPSVAVDLDGVLEASARPGALGEPLPGAMKGLRELEALGWRIVVWAQRGDARGIEQHLRRFGVPFTTVQVGSRPAADQYVDRRDVPLNGSWDEVLAAVVGEGMPVPGDGAEEEYGHGQHAGTGLIDGVDSGNDFGDGGMGSRRDRSVRRAPDREEMVY